MEGKRAVLSRRLAIVAALALSLPAFGQQAGSPFNGKWAGDVPGVGAARLTILQVRPTGQVEGGMEFELQSYSSKFRDKFEPATNSSRGMVDASTLVIESALGGVYQLVLQGDVLSGTYARGTTYRVPVQFKRL
jgi:hypothetical protein